MVRDFIVFELLTVIAFLPTALALVIGFKSLIFLPFIVAALIALFRGLNGSDKKKARRVRADGRSCKSIIAETIIHQNDNGCQEEISRLQKKRREVFIYE